MPSATPGVPAVPAPALQDQAQQIAESRMGTASTNREPHVLLSGREACEGASEPDWSEFELGSFQAPALIYVDALSYEHCRLLEAVKKELAVQQIMAASFRLQRVRERRRRRMSRWAEQSCACRQCLMLHKASDAKCRQRRGWLLAESWGQKTTLKFSLHKTSLLLHSHIKPARSPVDSIRDWTALGSQSVPETL